MLSWKWKYFFQYRPEEISNVFQESHTLLPPNWRNSRNLSIETKAKKLIDPSIARTFSTIKKKTKKEKKNSQNFPINGSTEPYDDYPLNFYPIHVEHFHSHYERPSSSSERSPILSAESRSSSKVNDDAVQRGRDLRVLLSPDDRASPLRSDAVRSWIDQQAYGSRSCGRWTMRRDDDCWRAAVSFWRR